MSISSQRRFLYYWSLLTLTPEVVPRHFWTPPALSTTTAEQTEPSALQPRVWLKHIKVRVREPSIIKQTAISILNSAMETVGVGRDIERGKGEIWVSLARYNDGMVDEMERWEKRTRGDRVGQRQKGADLSKGFNGEPGLKDFYTDGKWDNEKMVRSFARLGAEEGGVVDGEDSQVRVSVTCALTLLLNLDLL